MVRDKNAKPTETMPKGAHTKLSHIDWPYTSHQASGAIISYSSQQHPHCTNRTLGCVKLFCLTGLFLIIISMFIIIIINTHRDVVLGESGLDVALVLH
jgi:hypothetical protein